MEYAYKTAGNRTEIFEGFQDYTGNAKYAIVVTLDGERELYECNSPAVALPEIKRMYQAWYEREPEIEVWKKCREQEQLAI